MPWEEYRDAALHHGEKIFAAKARLDWKLLEMQGKIKKSVFKYIDGKRKCRNNTVLFQDEDGHLPHRDMDKAEVFIVFFTSVFNRD